MTDEHFAWKQYQPLESEFLYTLDYVELTPNHLGVYSYKFMNLIVAVGVEFDTVSNRLLGKWIETNAIRDPSLASELASTLQKREEGTGKGFSISHYRKAFEHMFSASTRVVSVNRLEANGDISPFYPPPSGPAESLRWWRGFTNLKHDRIRTLLESATMKNALEALAALLIVNLYFMRVGLVVSLPGLSVSQLFTVPFLKARARTSAVERTEYSFEE